jgi:sugar O-acyltransferase (sialic acid O-acetyltransferase NeuD family)
MAQRAVIFGTGSFADVVAFYLEHDSEYEVAAFTATGDFVGKTEHQGRPLVPFDRVADEFPPRDHDIFVAVGYSKLNKVREKFLGDARAKGYRALTYIASKATVWPELKIGENCFVFEDNTIQPFVLIGDNTILWSGNHIGHHSTIGPHCFISSHVVVSGHCHIGSHCFIGVNATISENISIAERNLIGPATLIQKNTKPDEAYIAERTAKFGKDSSWFFR